MDEMTWTSQPGSNRTDRQKFKVGAAKTNEVDQQYVASTDGII